jgi:methyl-accepting chemotaxis protein
MASSLLLSLVAGGIGLFGLMKVAELRDRMAFIVTVLAERTRVTTESDIRLLDYVREQKNFILSTDEAGRNESEANQQDALAKLNTALTDWDPVATDAGRKDIAEIRANLATYVEMNSKIKELARTGHVAEAQKMSMDVARPVFMEIRKPLKASRERAAGTMAKQHEETVALYNSLRWSMLAVIFVGVGFGIAISWYVVGQTTKRMNRLRDHVKDVAEGEGDLTKRIVIVHQDELGEIGVWINNFLAGLEQIVAKVAATSGEIAAASEELAASASHQAKSAEQQSHQTAQVSVAMQQMSSSVMEVSRNSEQASAGTQAAGNVARDGGKTVDATVAIMREIATATRSSAETVQSLGKSSDEVGKIVNVISEIASQTSLLALNAAIEAARAGEQGRGFAVVAGEVRSLSERTAEATKEIAHMITGIQSETRRAVAAMEESTGKVDDGLRVAKDCADALDQITTNAISLEKLVGQIAAATTEQSASTQQVNGNMEEIARIVAGTSHAAQESASACENLTRQAEDLQQLVGRFKVGAVLRDTLHESKASVGRNWR